MTTYMVSFRIAEVGDDDARREALIGAMLQGSERHWDETTSFLIIETPDTISELADWAERSIDTARDIVLIREFGRQLARVVGRVRDNDLFRLMPHCTKV